MRSLVLPILCIANLGQAPAVKGGTVTGTVTPVVKGKPARVDDVYVYLVGTTKPRNSLGRDVVAKIEQKNTEFMPHVAVIPRGAKVFFPNRDDSEHNVFSPDVKKNDWYGFDLGRYGTDKTGRHHQFLQDGEFDIYCDIHKNMSATVKVVPTRYFTRVVDGKFSLADIPPGTYTLVAWAPGSRETRSAQPFTVAANDTTKVASLPLQYTPKSRVHARIDGNQYDDYSSP
jgi:plastocyanin